MHIIMLGLMLLAQYVPAGGNLYPRGGGSGGNSSFTQHVTSQALSVSNLQANITISNANDFAVVTVGAYNNTPVTFTKVTIDGNTSCSTGTNLTSVGSGATTTGNSAQGATAIWYTGALTAASHTFTVCTSATANNLEMAVYELHGGLGLPDTPTIGKVQNGSSVSGIATGVSATSSFSIEACVAHNSDATFINANPASGSTWTSGGTIFSNTSDGVVSLNSTSTAIPAPKWQFGVDGTFNESQVCMK